MVRHAVTGVIFWYMAAGLPAQEPPTVRVQGEGERTYFQFRMKAPADMRIPKGQRQALDKIAPHDLARYPRLVPQDAAARAVAWHVSADAKTLEFFGVGTPGRFRLMYPTESDDKPPRRGWKEVDLTVDSAAAVKVPAATAMRQPKAPADDDLEGRWAAAWARELAVRERLAGDAETLRYARQKLCSQFGVTDPLPRPSLISPRPEAAELTVNIREIPGIEAADHPWKELLAGREMAVEPLAALVPREFYYVRLRKPEGGAEVLDRLQRWAAALVQLGQGASHDYRLRDRYERQLALPVDERGGFRLPRGAREIAIAGSDLHFRMGTDVSMLFAVADMKAFREDSDAGLTMARRAFGAKLEEKRERVGGAEVESFVTPGGEVRLHRAFLGDIAVVSNSPAAIRRIIDVSRQPAGSLAATPDFRLLRTVFHPDSPTEEVLTFFSEAFEQEQCGPRHRILLRRRSEELAARRAERNVLLFGAWNSGKPLPEPPATFSPPLIERAIDKISREEDEYYQQFREYHRTELAQYLAPMAMRFHAVGGQSFVSAFVMAPRSADFWDGVRRRLGKGTVAREAGEMGGFARLLASCTPDSIDHARLKIRLIQMGVDRKQLEQRVEWMGDRVALHLDDGPALAKLAEHFLHADLTADDVTKSRDTRDERWLLSQLPLTAAFDIVRPLFYQGTLKRAKEIALATFPKTLTWETLPEPFRRIQITRVQPSPAAALLAFGKLLKPEDLPGIYYADAERTLVVALSLAGLKAGLVREALPNRARQPLRDRANAWLSLNLGSSADLQAYLRTYVERESHRQALASAELWRWLYECGALSGSESAAERDAVARRWLGFEPASPDRSRFRWDGERREVVSERHGSARQPVLHDSPAAESPWLSVLSDFARVRGELHVRPDGIIGTVMIERK